MPRLYSNPPHTGSTPKAMSYAAAAGGGSKPAPTTPSTSTSGASNTPATKPAAAAPAPVVAASANTSYTAAVGTGYNTKPVSQGDGLSQCDSCGKTLFGSGQMSGGRKYCTKCFNAGGASSHAASNEWTPAKSSAGAGGTAGGAKKSYAAAAGANTTKSGAAGGQQRVKATLAPGALDRPSPKNAHGLTECHFCDEPITGSRAPEHDVGGEPYCDVCYKQMANSLADANEKAAEIAYKFGGAGGSGQSLADRPSGGGGGRSSFQATAGMNKLNASNISDGDLKSMFMANYRKSKQTGGAGATNAMTAAAIADSGAAGGPVCAACNNGNDAGARFCANCGGPLS